MNPAENVSVHEEDVVSLVGRASAPCLFPDLGFSDPAAESILDALDLDPSSLDTRRLRAATVRTMAVDGLVSHFFARFRDGIGVALYPGLCTRFRRIDNGALHWIDIDRPDVAAFRCSILPSPERHIVAASCSLGCSGWLNLLRDARDVPLLLVSEGPLSRHAADVVETFLTHASERMPRGTEFVVGYDARLPLRPSTLRRRGACLEVLKPDGSVARYPRMRFVAPEEVPAAVQHEVEGLNGVSRLFRGRGIPSIAHLRFF